MKILSYLSMIFVLASAVSCGESKKNKPIPDQEPQQRQDISCSMVGQSSNSCLNEHKIALSNVKDLDQLAAHMAAITETCKPNPTEFREFLCQFN